MENKWEGKKGNRRILYISIGREGTDSSLDWAQIILEKTIEKNNFKKHMLNFKICF